jgi:hypothetical protein
MRKLGDSLNMHIHSDKAEVAYTILLRLYVTVPGVRNKAQHLPDLIFLNSSEIRNKIPGLGFRWAVI